MDSLVGPGDSPRTLLGFTDSSQAGQPVQTLDLVVWELSAPICGVRRLLCKTPPIGKIGNDHANYGLIKFVETDGKKPWIEAQKKNIRGLRPDPIYNLWKSGVRCNCRSRFDVQDRSGDRGDRLVLRRSFATQSLVLDAVVPGAAEA